MHYIKHDLFDTIQDEVDFLIKSFSSIDFSINIVDVETFEVIYSNNEFNDKLIMNKNQPKCYEISHHNTSPCSGINHKCPISEISKNKESFSIIHKHFSKNNNEEYFEVIGSPIFDKLGNLQYIIETSRNISDIYLSDEGLHYIANHDNLTDLANRNIFMDRLRKNIFKSERDNTEIAILFIDIDRFKQINDTFGHSIGDEVIIEVAKRLKSIVRNIDTIARFGGDEFVIMFNDMENYNIIHIVNKILTLFTDPISSESINVSISIGISLYKTDIKSTNNEIDNNKEIDLLINYADTAMYKAKEKYGSSFEFYHSSMTNESNRIFKIEKALRKAVINNEFVIHYQPKYNIKTSTIIGFEALIRWNHPKKGLVYPDYFIAIAESHSIITDITQFVINKVAEDLATLYSLGLNPGIISINIDKISISNTECFDVFSKIVQKNNCKFEWFGIEVLERFIATESNDIISNLNKFKENGCKIYIDDFGTGYSSLSALTKLPLNVLKIDKSFIDNLFDDKSNLIIIKTIIALAKGLELDVIAEGVETEKQKEFLSKQDCDIIQGYLFAKPMSYDNVIKFLEKRI
jgi:diguanylate cyclase (GGDEF)-like protein